jgi:hypothetical protein
VKLVHVCRGQGDVDGRQALSGIGTDLVMVLWPDEPQLPRFQLVSATIEPMHPAAFFDPEELEVVMVMLANAAPPQFASADVPQAAARQYI